MFFQRNFSFILSICNKKNHFWKGFNNREKLVKTTHNWTECVPDSGRQIILQSLFSNINNHHIEWKKTLHWMCELHSHLKKLNVCHSNRLFRKTSRLSLNSSKLKLFLFFSNKFLFFNWNLIFVFHLEFNFCNNQFLNNSQFGSNVTVKHDDSNLLSVIHVYQNIHQTLSTLPEYHKGIRYFFSFSDWKRDKIAKIWLSNTSKNVPLFLIHKIFF